MGKGKKLLLVIVLLVVLLVLGGGLVVMHFTDTMNYTRDGDVNRNSDAYQTETEKIDPADLYHPEDVVMATEEQTKDMWTLLLIGGASPEKNAENDERGDADAILLLTFNTPMKTLYATAFNTDLYTIIPDSGPGYLGNAYAIGGGPLMVQTITENYGVRIDNYAVISIAEAAKVMNMPELSDLDIGHEGVKVLRELIFSLNIVEPSKVVGKLTELLSTVTHNIDSKQMIGLLMKAPGYVSFYSQDEMLPYDGLYQEVQGYLVPDIGETANRLQNTIYAREDQQS